MKRLAALFLCFFVGSAFAAPQCWPKPFGAGSYMVTSTAVQPNEFGEWAYWFCPDPYRVSFVITARAKDRQLKFPATDGMSVAQTLDAIWTANVDTRLDDEKLIALEGAAVAHIEAHMPPRPKWAVAKNGTTLTRPVYARNANGTLGPLVSGVRATVGATCLCADEGLRVVSGTSTYCATKTGEPVQVTLCKLVP
jgi:hypothetical protein